MKPKHVEIQIKGLILCQGPNGGGTTDLKSTLNQVLFCLKQQGKVYFPP